MAATTASERRRLRQAAVLNATSLTKVTVATPDTSHCTGPAVGAHREGAEAAIVAAFARHRQQYTGADPYFMVDAIIDGEVQFAEIAIGGATRDGETL